MNVKQVVFSPMANVDTGITSVGAAIEQLDIEASANSTTFSQLVYINASITSQPKESQVNNTTLLEIIITIGGSASPTHSAYEAVRKAKNHATWLKFCDLNGYCFS